MRRLLTARWLVVHASVVVLVVAFALLCWWQVSRARHGNALSFGYALEWPAFAAFLVYVWVKEMRRALSAPPPAAETPASTELRLADDSSPVRAKQHLGPAYDDSDDDELAAYNRYLAWLNDNPRATPAQYPG